MAWVRYDLFWEIVFQVKMVCVLDDGMSYVEMLCGGAMW